MVSIHVTRQHQAGLALARAEVERIARRAREDHGADYAWDGDTLRFSHLGVVGHIAVSATAIDLRVRLGLVLAPLKTQIESVLVEKIDRALARHGAAVG